MSQSVFGAAAVVTMLNRAFNNSSPAAAVFSNQVQTAGTTADSQFAFARQFGASFDGLDNAALTNLVLGNMGMLPDSTGLVDFVTNYLDGVAKVDRGVVVLQLGMILAGLENATGDLAVYASKAVAWNKEVEQSYTYSADPASSTPFEGDFAPVDTGTFKLTHSTDTATANKFVADQVYTPGGDDRINSLQDEDTLTGAGDNPTLTATLGNANDNGATIITPELNGIQTVNVAFTGSGGAAVTDLDLQDSTGLTELNISRVSQSINRAEVGNIRSALDSISIRNTNANQAGTVEVSFAAGALAGENTGTLTLNNVNLLNVNVGQNNSGIGANGVAGQGYENLTIVSTGAANTAANLNLPMDTGTSGQITITGDQNLTVAAGNNVFQAGTGLAEARLFNGGIAGNFGRLSAIDASGLDAALVLNIQAGTLSTGKAGTSGVNQDVTITGTAKGDTFYLNDAVQAGDTINGGDGTDTLVVYTGGVTKGTVSGVENLDVQANNGAVTIDLDRVADANLLNVRNIGTVFNFGTNRWESVDNGNNAVATFNNLTATQAAGLNIQHSTSNNGALRDTTIVANLKNAAGTSDTVGVSINEGVNADNRFNFTLTAAKVENITLTDNDSESNTVLLSNFAQHTGTVTIADGAAKAAGSTFINLDANAQVNGTGDALLAQQGLLRKDVNAVGTVTDLTAAGEHSGNATAAGFSRGFVDVGNDANQVRLQAATINASAATADVIVRVSTNNAAGAAGGQTITTGAGNDWVIFDNLNDIRAGLTISDKVNGGEGTDNLVIDGHNARVTLGASEWTNVRNFENIVLVGNNMADNNARGASNAYNLTLTNSLINNNGAEDGNGNRLINIINDNEPAEVADLIARGATNGVSINRGVTIDGRGLDATHNFSYNGREGLAGEVTADRFILSDANINGVAQIDGGALLAAGGPTGYKTNNAANNDVLEVRNSAEVTVGDLLGVSNVGTLEFTNDTSNVQTSRLELDSDAVNRLVNTSRTADAANVETLFIRSFENVAGVSDTALTIDASQVVGSYALNINTKGTANAGNDVVTLNVNLGAAGHTVELGAGTDTVAFVGALGIGATAAGDVSAAGTIKLGTDTSVTFSQGGATVTHVVDAGAPTLENLDLSGVTGLAALTLIGAVGTTLIGGSSGGDTINVAASGGSVTVIGGGGKDAITLSAQADTVVYKAASDSLQGAANADVIANFAVADFIDLSAVTNLGGSALNAAAYNGASAMAALGNAFGAGILVARNGANVFVDVNGDGVLDAGDMQIVLTGAPAVTAANFLV